MIPMHQLARQCVFKLVAWSMLSAVTVAGLCGCGGRDHTPDHVRNEAGRSTQSRRFAETRSAMDNGSAKPRIDSAMSIINRFGTFLISASHVKLVVSERQGLVYYQLLDISSNRPVLNSNSGSMHSQWYFCWSDSDELWVYSGDIGTCVWRKCDQGYCKEDMTNENAARLVSAMPKVFFDAASPTRKTLWLKASQ